MSLEWVSVDEFVVGDIRIRVAGDLNVGIEVASDQLLLVKPRWMVEEYVRLIDQLQPRRIIELGIFNGGSTAFLATYTAPQKLVAIELRPSSTALFTRWLEREDVSARVTACFGVDQSDRERLLAIVSAEFGDASLDLVIDDASHLLTQTRSSFDTLFPILRPGGWYVIEDWATGFGVERKIATDSAVRNAVVETQMRRAPESRNSRDLPLAALVLELVLASAYTDFIDDIHIRPGWLALRRSDAAHRLPDSFTVAGCLLKAGRSLLSYV